MPIWSEILVLSLAAYFLGLGAGWFIWGRGAAETPDDDADDNDDIEENP